MKFNALCTRMRLQKVELATLCPASAFSVTQNRNLIAKNVQTIDVLTILLHILPEKICDEKPAYTRTKSYLPCRAQAQQSLLVGGSKSPNRKWEILAGPVWQKWAHGQKKKLALRFELRTNRFAICCATTAPYELCLVEYFNV